MTLDKRYTVLNELSPYGRMYTRISADNKPFYSEGYVVKFKKSTGEEWIANFRPGWTDYDNIFDLTEMNLIAVFAGGQGYIMDPDQENPKMTFGLTITFVLQKDDGTLICSDNVHIFILDKSSGKLWKSDRISWDGIKDLKLTKNKLHGRSYDPTNFDRPWTDFTLDLETKDIRGGSFQDFLVSNKHRDVQEKKLRKAEDEKGPSTRLG